MWRRAYLFLILVRLYFALSPSYLHPDENFQGPEVIAGRVFNYPAHHTWEFTSDHPIRSVFPLWLIYGFPMYVLRGLWEGSGRGEVPPAVTYYTLRILMFVLSFVLEDWALQELVQNPRHRRNAVILVASSYVTWTWQTHTFSNSIETLALLWSLVLIARIVDDRHHSGVVACIVLAFCTVLGTFNRITFPAFIMIPGFGLFPHFWRKPFSLVTLVLASAFFALVALALDTSFYSHPETITWRRILLTPIITPINNLFYNTSTINLAQHGLHPYYQHLVANLPQLLGPAFPLIFTHPRRTWRLYAAACGTLVLSCFPHQEARFLMPAIPLILSSVRLPKSKVVFKIWITVWVAFNAIMGIFMGAYHQGGVVPAQIYLGRQHNITTAFYWRTYSPPIWLLDGNATAIQVYDTMGAAPEDLTHRLIAEAPCIGHSWKTMSSMNERATVLAAPYSAIELDRFTRFDASAELQLTEVWRHSRHLNLDDLDIPGEGVWGTLQRVIGRRGLVIWKVEKNC